MSTLKILSYCSHPENEVLIHEEQHMKLKVPVTVGRNPHNHIQLMYACISRSHGEFERDTKGIYYRHLSMHPDNVTTITGDDIEDGRIITCQRDQRYLLKDGDVISLSGAKVRIRITD